MCLRMIYVCRLRLREGTQLQVTDIDPQRLLVRVRQGKGGKDRYVPLADRTLQLLREYWQHVRSRLWLFPRHRSMPVSATSPKDVQSGGALERHPKEASICATTGTPMRSISWSGVARRVIQERLRHRSEDHRPLYAS